MVPAVYNLRMDWHKHIERVPGVMLGKPIFRQTRITVEFVLERLSQGAGRMISFAVIPP